MELLLLLLLVPIIWLVLLPGRIAKRARKYRMAGASVLFGAMIAGWVGIQAFSAAQPKLDYSAGDTELRALLLQPEIAPRYSLR
jgi:hypothetical protein